MEADYDMTTQSIKHLRIRQEKLKLFLHDTEQRIPEGTYIKKTLGVIENSNYINKDVLKWRRRPLVDQTIADFWTFFKEVHKKQKMKLQQGHDEQASSVMIQKQMSDFELQLM